MYKKYIKYTISLSGIFLGMLNFTGCDWCECCKTQKKTTEQQENTTASAKVSTPEAKSSMPTPGAKAPLVPGAKAPL